MSKDELQHRAVRRLKIWPEFYEAIERGEKTFEVRKDDGEQPFRVGDILHLREWLPKREAYTGRHMLVDVTYLIAGPAFGIERGFVCMAIRPAAMENPALSP
jgi:hypothetical protein